MKYLQTLILLLALSCGAQTILICDFSKTNVITCGFVNNIYTNRYWPISGEPEDGAITNLIISKNYQGTVEMDGHRMTAQTLRGLMAVVDNYEFVTNNISYSCISNSILVATIAVSENSKLARKLSKYDLDLWLSQTTTTNSPDGTFKVEWIEGGFKESFSDVPGNSGFSSMIDAQIARTNYCADFVAEFYQGPKVK